MLDVEEADDALPVDHVLDLEGAVDDSLGGVALKPERTVATKRDWARSSTEL